MSPSNLAKRGVSFAPVQPFLQTRFHPQNGRKNQPGRHQPSLDRLRRAESVDESSRPESPASIAIKSLELDGAKAGDLKVRVEANEWALDDLQKVQSKAGDIADKAAEGDFPFGGDQSVVTVKPLPRSSTAASVVP